MMRTVACLVLLAGIAGADVSEVALVRGAPTFVINGAERVVVGPVAERLDPSCGGTGPDGDEHPALFSYFAYPFNVVRCCDASFDKADVIGPFEYSPAGLGEIGYVNRAGDKQQLIFRVQDQSVIAPIDDHRQRLVGAGDLVRHHLLFR